MTAAVAQTLDYDGLTIEFDDRLLRPRPWTAAQAHWAASCAAEAPAGPILELCSGAGQIGLLAARLTGRSLVAVDIDPVAGHYLNRNAATAGLADRVEFRVGPMLDVVQASEQFGLILADPPWVPAAGVAQFPEDPLTAIDGGDDGLALARQCLTVIDRVLAPRGVALLQLGTPQQSAALARESGATLHFGETREYTAGVILRLDRPTPGP